MARRAEPAAVKAAKGNPGRRKIASEADAAPAKGASFKAPRGLNAVEIGLWSKIAPALAEMRILRLSDLPAFRRYIVLLAKWRDAEKLLRGAKLVQVTSSEHVQNMERMSKALMVAIMIDKRLGEIEDRFGMNPAARQGLLMKMAATAQQPSLPLGDQAEDPAPAPLQASPIGALQPAGNC